jgi:hypothetical protein
MTSETQRVSVPNAASKTLRRKYSPPNQSGKIANPTRTAASSQPEIFFAEFILNRASAPNLFPPDDCDFRALIYSSTYGIFS